MTTADKLDKQIKRLEAGAVTLVDKAALKAKLATGRPLIVKLGADPSAPDLHLGHAVVLQKLRTFQELGHDIRFVIGDFTGRIGDPTGKSKTRPPLTEEQLRKNAETYKQQVFKILDERRTQLMFNSTWLAALNLQDLLQISAKTTIAQLIERDDFMKRYRAGRPIALVEFFYPLLQAYDSVELHADVELGGSDQTFNLLFARDFQRACGQAPQVILTVPLLVGLDGQDKMSKSLGNIVGLTMPPNDMYGKLMSLPDKLITSYFTLLTDMSSADVAEMETAMSEGANPRDYKMQLARSLVTRFHSAAAAVTSAAEFKQIFQDGGVPTAPRTLELVQGAAAPTLLEVLAATGDFASKSEIRRLVKSGAVKLADAPLKDETAKLTFRAGSILRVGKRRFFKLVVKL